MADRLGGEVRARVQTSVGHRLEESVESSEKIPTVANDTFASMRAWNTIKRFHKYSGERPVPQVSKFEPHRLVIARRFGFSGGAAATTHNQGWLCYWNQGMAGESCTTKSKRRAESAPVWKTSHYKRTNSRVKAAATQARRLWKYNELAGFRGAMRSFRLH